MDYLHRSYKPKLATILDLDSALNGFEAMDKVNLSTSPGYPYVCFGKNKHHYFECDPATGHVTTKDPLFSKYLTEYIGDWQYKCYETVWIVSLKDETLKPNKLARVFEVAPMEYTLATRAYFGSWIEMMHSIHAEKFSCVGINPESFEWTLLFNKSSRLSPYGIDADVPNWDKNLLAYILHLATKSVNAWYKKCDPNWKIEHDMARISLCYSMVNGFLIAGHAFFRKHKGMSSGWVLTALFNTLCNMIQHLIWYMLSVPLAMQDLSFYDDHVDTKIYGDDSLDGILATSLQWLNRQTMASVYAEYCCMTITDSSKGKELSPYDPLDQLTFLKRGFRKDGMYIKPVLSMTSLITMICFVRKSRYISSNEQLQTNLKTFASFLYFHGPVVYAYFTEYLDLCFPTLSIPSYSYYDNLYLHGDYEIRWF